MTRLLAYALAGLLAASCASNRSAPVVERGNEPPPAPVEAPKPAPEPPPVEKPLPTHVVKPRETLVGIALQYGLDYRELAAWNGITNPNALKAGQVLVVAQPPLFKAPVPGAAPVATPLASAGPPIEARPLANTPTLKVEPRGQKVPYSERALAQLGSPEAAAAASPAAPAATPAAPAPAPSAPAPEPEKGGTASEDVDWTWPVKGKVLAPFTEASKGVDIGARKGAPIVAAAAGRVIYAGDLRAYGKLVILKHNNTWVSAYAHNDRLLVKEGDDVKRGQKIAEMGSSDTDQVKLHFEVRRQGKPVDPARILPAP